jgi:hypothetical protein
MSYVSEVKKLHFISLCVLSAQHVSQECSLSAAGEFCREVPQPHSLPTAPEFCREVPTSINYQQLQSSAEKFPNRIHYQQLQSSAEKFPRIHYQPLVGSAEHFPQQHSLSTVPEVLQSSSSTALSTALQFRRAFSPATFIINSSRVLQSSSHQHSLSAALEFSREVPKPHYQPLESSTEHFPQQLSLPTSSRVLHSSSTTAFIINRWSIHYQQLQSSTEHCLQQHYQPLENDAEKFPDIIHYQPLKNSAERGPQQYSLSAAHEYCSSSYFFFRFYTFG